MLQIPNLMQRIIIGLKSWEAFIKDFIIKILHLFLTDLNYAHKELTFVTCYFIFLWYDTKQQNQEIKFLHGFNSNCLSEKN